MLENNFKYMNTRQKGYYRDKCIVETIEMFECLNTEQIYYLFFTNIKYGIVKCRERLRVLKEKGKINSIRVDINECNYYFINKKSKFMIHDINRNWGYIYLLYLYKFKEYYKFVEIKNEYVFKCGQRADGIIGFKNYVTNEYKYVIIESDRVDSRNKFNKIKEYVDIYRNGRYKNEFWYKKVNRFPNVLIVCDSEKKKLKILEIEKRDNIKFVIYDENIGKENKLSLKFIVLTVDEIKREVINYGKRISY